MQEQNDRHTQFRIPYIKELSTLIVLGLIIYFNCFFNDFVWDDIGQIVTSPLTHTLTSLPTIFTTGQVNTYYRPVFLSYLTIVNTIFQGNVFFFHFLQVGMHIINSILIFVIFRKLMNSKIAFLASLIFLVHPINVEAVAYISAVSDVLVFLFGIIGLYLLTKESGVVWIFIGLLYLILLKHTKKRSMLFLIVIPFGIYSFLRFVVAHTITSTIAIVPIDQLSLPQRLLTVPKIIYFYVTRFLYPAQLAISQNWLVRSTSIQDFWFPLCIDFIFLFLIIIGGIYLLKQHKHIFKNYLFLHVGSLSA